MKIGIDIIDIDRMRETFSENSEILNKLFVPQEIEPWNLQSTCGKIAAKEAIMKTGYLKPGDWLKVQIISDLSGAPLVYDAEGNLISKVSVSISHTESIAIATALYETS